MAWEGSTRRDRLPPGWSTRTVPRILQRDGRRCQLAYDGCTGEATEVDHITPGDDHRDENLQAVCSWCHSRKTAAEGNAARTRYSRRRPPERHPGLL